jgi:hypothetical protein
VTKRDSKNSYTEFSNFDSPLLSIKIINCIFSQGFFLYYIFNINIEMSISVFGHVYNSSSTRILGKGNGRVERIRRINKCINKHKENFNHKLRKQDLDTVGRMRKEQKDTRIGLHIWNVRGLYPVETFKQ